MSYLINPYIVVSGVAPTFVTSANNSNPTESGNTSVSVTAPAGRSAGNLLIVSIYYAHGSVNATQNANWTIVKENGFHCTYRRIATNTSADNFTATHSPEIGWSAHYTVWNITGSTISSDQAGSSGQTTSPVTVTAPSFTMPNTGGLILPVVMSSTTQNGGNSPTITTPDGWSGSHSTITHNWTFIRTTHGIYTRPTGSGAIGTVNVTGQWVSGGSTNGQIHAVQIGVS